MNNLDAEQQEILAAFERGELKRVPNLAQELERHREIAVISGNYFQLNPYLL